MIGFSWFVDLVAHFWAMLHIPDTHFVALVELVSNVDNAIVILAYASAFSGGAYLAVVLLGYICAAITRGPFLLLGGAVMGYWWAVPLACLILMGLCVKHFVTTPEENALQMPGEASGSLAGFALIVAIGLAVMQTASIDIACAGENVLAALSVAHGNSAIAWAGTIEGMMFTGLSLPVLRLLMARFPGLEDGAFAAIGIIGVLLLLDLPLVAECSIIFGVLILGASRGGFGALHRLGAHLRSLFDQ